VQLNGAGQPGRPVVPRRWLFEIKRDLGTRQRAGSPPKSFEGPKDGPEEQEETENSMEENMQQVVLEAIRQFAQAEQTRQEPVLKAELTEERKRREQLEGRVNQLVEENKRARAQADQAERESVVRAELQRLGVAKIDLAYKAVKDDVGRTDDGRLVARSEQGEMGVREFLTHFVSENPELLPARIPGGSGATAGNRVTQSSPGMDLDKIRPGMSAEDLERIREEVSRVASQTLRGY